MGSSGNITDYLGPARVTEVGDTPMVALEACPEGTLVRARMVLAFPYRPVLGDQLLVVGDDRAFWAIGVLAGRGFTRFPAGGRASLRAEGGRLALVGERGVGVSAQRVRIETRRLRRRAATAHGTMGRLSRRVRDVMSTDVGELDELSQSRFLLQARRAVVKSLHAARVKSLRVRLG